MATSMAVRRLQLLLSPSPRRKVTKEKENGHGGATFSLPADAELHLPASICQKHVCSQTLRQDVRIAGGRARAVYPRVGTKINFLPLVVHEVRMHREA
jgi:hypothetical protein